jgi:predicted ABC-type transport system involved in lysophospholipase L1 biosynthesis ATPase subunit
MSAVVGRPIKPDAAKQGANRASGAGKSVLLRLLIGLQQPDSGRICIQGVGIAGLGGKPLYEIRKKIGFLFQQGALYDSLTVEENVTFPLSRHTTLNAEGRKGRARELLESVGMERDLNKMPSGISAYARFSNYRCLTEFRHLTCGRQSREQDESRSANIRLGP